MAAPGEPGLVTLGPLAQVRGSGTSRSSIAVVAAAAGLILLKLWLVSAQPIIAIGRALYDDRLFLNLAHNLLGGAWLGPFNELTLVKGCFYPIWIALVARLGIPLLLSQHLLYLLAVVAMVAAVRPMGYGRWRLLVLGGVLWFNPGTYTFQVLRVIRQGIYPALTLLVIAGFVGTLLRARTESWRALGPWLLLSAPSLAAFWQTREEGVWLLPFLAGVVAFVVGRQWWVRAPRGWSSALACVIPLLAIPCSDGIVALINKAHYGIAVTVELKSHGFTAAYGALTRVKPKHLLPGAPVSKEARELIYPVSPAFATLEPLLEGPVGKAWGPVGRAVWPDLKAGEIAGGWFVWAFREAVARAGDYASGRKAMGFYRRLASEVDSACRAGKLDCLPARASMMPPWVPGYGKALLKTFSGAALFTVSFDGVSADPTPSVGDDSTLALYRDLTHDRIAPRGTFPDVRAQSSASERAAENVRLLDRVIELYRVVMPILAGLALFAFIVQIVEAIRKRTIAEIWVVQAGLLGAWVALLLLLSLLDVTSFPAIDPLYLSAAYPVLIVLVLLALFERERIVSRRGPWWKLTVGPPSAPPGDTASRGTAGRSRAPARWRRGAGPSTSAPTRSCTRPGQLAKPRSRAITCSASARLTPAAALRGRCARIRASAAASPARQARTSALACFFSNDRSGDGGNAAMVRLLQGPPGVRRFGHERGCR